MFIYSTFINSITGKHKTISEVQLKCLLKKRNQKTPNHQELVGRVIFIPQCLKQRHFLAYLMAEAEIVKYSNKPLFFFFFNSTVSVLSVEQWDTKGFEGRKNIAGIQKQPELLFQGMIQTHRVLPQLLVFVKCRMYRPFISCIIRFSKICLSGKSVVKFLKTLTQIAKIMLLMAF